MASISLIFFLGEDPLPPKVPHPKIQLNTSFSYILNECTVIIMALWIYKPVLYGVFLYDFKFMLHVPLPSVRIACPALMCLTCVYPLVFKSCFSLCVYPLFPPGTLMSFSSDSLIDNLCLCFVFCFLFCFCLPFGLYFLFLDIMLRLWLFLIKLTFCWCWLCFSPILTKTQNVFMQNRFYFFGTEMKVAP